MLGESFKPKPTPSSQPAQVPTMQSIDLRNKFRQSNGLWDKLELNSETARNLIYKLRLALGLTYNPEVEKIHKISPPYNMMKRYESTFSSVNNNGSGNQNNGPSKVKLETWVAKEEIEYPDDIFG